jgi:hypothetical protein
MGAAPPGIRAVEPPLGDQAGDDAVLDDEPGDEPPPDDEPSGTIH